MTAKRATRKPVAARVGLTEPRRRQLLTGFALGFDDDYGRDAEDTADGLERLREAWLDHGDELVAECVEKAPGTRPWAWWVVVATARRETADGSPHPFDRPERRTIAEEWHAKYPTQNYLQRFFQLDATKLPRMTIDNTIYESEATYLQRLGFLEPGEMERIPSKSWEPYLTHMAFCSRIWNQR